LHQALANTRVAAANQPVRITVRGKPDRCRIELRSQAPPRPVVRETPLSGVSFERILGTAAERRGVDLAIPARVSELFGGSARLQVEPGHATTIVLDWPARPSETSCSEEAG
jgi:hypothetical protein